MDTRHLHSAHVPDATEILGDRVSNHPRSYACI